jgi:hypothetical protein
LLSRNAFVNELGGANLFAMSFLVGLTPAHLRAEHELQAIIDSLEPYQAKSVWKGKVVIVGSGSVAGLAEMWSREVKVFIVMPDLRLSEVDRNLA